MINLENVNHKKISKKIGTIPLIITYIFNKIDT